MLFKRLIGYNSIYNKTIYKSVNYNYQMDKKVMPALFLFVFTILLVALASAHLGMRPAKMEFDFRPGEEIIINYYVDTTPDVRMRIVAEGDMTENVTFSKDEMKGSGSFLAKIKMPVEAKKPGKNDLYIFVKQIVDEEKGFGTAIAIGALVRINVPYPGKYAEIELNVENANKGEPVNTALKVTSRGKEAITVNPLLDVYFKDELIESIPMSSEGARVLQPAEEHTFKRAIDTKEYLPGNYRAVARVDYGAEDGKPAIAEQLFRIGSLNIEIINYTNSIRAGKISPFVVEIQSDWKDTIEGVYANVSLFDETGAGALSFLTPPVTVSGFQNYQLKGFADATALKKGIYNSNITLHYADKSSSIRASIEVIGGISVLVIVITAAAVLIVILIIFIYFMIKRKNKSK